MKVGKGAERVGIGIETSKQFVCSSAPPLFMLFITGGWLAAHLTTHPTSPTLSPHLHSEMLDNLCVTITQTYVMLNSSSVSGWHV